MIQIQTLLKVADNSGGKLVRCIKILKKGAKTRYAKVGDIIVVSVQQIRAKNKLTSKVKKGDVGKIISGQVYWNGAGVWVRKREAGQSESVCREKADTPVLWW